MIDLPLRSLVFVAVLLGVTGCSVQPGESQGALPPYPVKNPNLQNLVRVSTTIYSGGQPHGDESFAELARLGVKTVVSVDGATPDAETARKHGLRYVHIPIGYDGIGDNAGRSLARLVREGEGPFYVHCHHGRHRAPVAAAIACIAAGGTDNAEARRILELAGTSADYSGLSRDVEDYRPPPADAELPELVEVAQVSSFAAAMAALDRAYDNLKLCRDAGWASPEGHPDIVPSHEALILREGFHEAGRTLDDAGAELRRWLSEAEETARNLRRSLESRDRDTATAGFDAVMKSCRRCHAKYRDDVRY